MEFYPFDIKYDDNEEKIVVYGYTKEGEKVIVVDNSFHPYFYAVISPEDKESVINSIKNLKVIVGEKEALIKKIEEYQSHLVGRDVTTLKLTFNTYSEMKHFFEPIKRISGVSELLETDIPIHRRYLIDKRFKMFTRVRVEGEKVKSTSPNTNFTILADVIEETNSELIENPKIMAVDIETYNPIGNPRPEKDPILMISISTNYGFNKVISWKKCDEMQDFVEVVESEMDVLLRFEDIIKNENPQIIVGYNSDNFDFPYINERAKKYKLNLKLGVDNSKLKITKRGIGKAAKIIGIPHIDLFIFIRNILGPTLKTETYNLNAVADELIGEKKVEGFHWTEMSKMWDNGGDDLKKIFEYSMKDAEITLKLMEKLFNLIAEMTKIVGQTPFDVSRMTYGQCVEWFLAKNAHDFKELIPPKPLGHFVSDRQAKSYEGAYVHKPEVGLFENIVVYDFRSLYPSIIVSYNICPTTLFCDCCKVGFETPEINGKKYSFCKEKKGFIPQLLENLINRRIRIKEIIKKLPKNDEDYKILSARSYAIKTIANAMYGYLGFARSRWYCWECAASITALGRHYITKVISEAESKGFSVLYADTDSLFISLKNKSLEDSKKFIKEINSSLPEMMELDFQGFYSRGVFLAKKRYALSDTLGNLTIKGLEWVRRDWSKIAKETQIAVIKSILVDGSKEKAIRITRDTIKKLKEGKIPIDEVTIYTQLTRKIEDYESIGPHVSAAIKAKEKGYTFEPGQIIKYIIVKGSGSISDKAFILEDVLDRKLEYDPEYYINNQVIPAVEKIFEAVGISKDELLGKVQTKLGGFFGD